MKIEISYGQLNRLIKTEQELLDELKQFKDTDQETLDDVRSEITRLKKIRDEMMKR